MFIQKCVPYTDQLFVRLSSTGKRICTIKSIDYSTITSFCVHECEGPSRLNSRPRRYLFTGHSNGTIQVWDLTTALELKLLADSSTTSSSSLSGNGQGGPTPSEFAKLLDRIELASANSGYSTPTTTNCFSPCSYSSNGLNSASSKLANHKNLLTNSSSSAALSQQPQHGSVGHHAAATTMMVTQHVGSIMHHHNQTMSNDEDSNNIKNKTSSNEWSLSFPISCCFRPYRVFCLMRTTLLYICQRFVTLFDALLFYFYLF